MLLCLDLGLKTGVAIQTKLGVKSCTIYLKKNGKTFPEQLAYFYKFLEQINSKAIAMGDTLEIVFEMPHGGYFASTRVLFSMIGCIYLFQGLNNVETYEVSPKSIKKHITGNGNCSKEDMIKEMEKRTGRTMSSDNEADALGALYYHTSKDTK